MGHGIGARALVALSLIAAAGCADPPTEVVVLIDSDLPSLRSVRLRVEPLSGGARGPEERTVELGSGARGSSLPFSLVVRPAGGDASRRFLFSATGLDASGAAVVRTHVRTGFVRGRRLLLPIFLDSRCAGLSCGEERCVAGACASADVEVRLLCPVAPGGELRSACDAGFPDPQVRDDGGGPEGLPPPRLLAPANGAHTGGPRVPGALRPRLAWAEVGEAEGYELELGDACEGALPACAPGGARITQSGATTSFAPAEDLAIDAAAPGGRRYYWRVRSCGGGRCGAWSLTRYLDVGRHASDTHGDGEARLRIAAPGLAGGGGVYSYDGTPAAERPLQSEDGPDGVRFGAAVLTADFNADGFADLAIGSDGVAAAVHVYLGREGGPLATPDATIAHANGRMETRFGAALAAADLDADGFADLMVGAPGSGETPGQVLVYRGSARGLERDWAFSLTSPREEADRFGAALAAADLDADGFADLLVGAPEGAEGAGLGGGAIHLFRGSLAGLATEPSRSAYEASGDTGAAFGAALCARDFDGDGFPEVAVGAPGMARPAVSLFAGGLGAPGSPVLLPSPDAEERSAFGASLACEGDLDGDGAPDLAVGAPEAAGRLGRVHLYRGSPGALPSAPASALSDDTGGMSRLGAALSSGADLNDDGRSELAVGAPDYSPISNSGAGAVFVYLGDGSALVRDPALLVGDAVGAHFGAALSM